MAEKVLFQHEVFGHQRSSCSRRWARPRTREALRSIELMGTAVAPVVRAEVAKRAASGAAAHA